MLQDRIESLEALCMELRGEITCLTMQNAELREGSTHAGAEACAAQVQLLGSPERCPPAQVRMEALGGVMSSSAIVAGHCCCCKPSTVRSCSDNLCCRWPRLRL